MLVWLFRKSFSCACGCFGFRYQQGCLHSFASNTGYFGPGAQIFLAAMVIVTCFTTTAGLIVSSGEFFAERFPRFSYKVYATIFTLIGFGIANLGLNNIITFSVPVLLVLYPITICIVLITIVNKFVPLSTYGMQLTVGLVTALSLVEVLAGQFNWTAVSKSSQLCHWQDNH